MKVILVPTDFSENAENALRYALSLAQKSGADIVLMHAWSAIDTEFSNRKALFDDYNNAVEADLLQQLNDIREKYKHQSQVKIIPKLYNGHTRDAIKQSAEMEGADLIVMGTRGAGGLKKVLIGSITAGTIGSASVPVLAVPENAVWKGISGVLLATREVEISDRIFSPVLALAGTKEAAIHIAVFTDSGKKDVVDYLEHERLLNVYRQALPEKFKDAGFHTVHLEGENFEDTIEKYIAEKDIDILVMPTHKRSFLENIFSRSYTRQMSYHIKIPLLAIPV